MLNIEAYDDDLRAKGQFDHGISKQEIQTMLKEIRENRMCIRQYRQWIEVESPSALEALDEELRVKGVEIIR